MVLTIRALVLEFKFRITTLVLKLVDQSFVRVTNTLKCPKASFDRNEGYSATETDYCAYQLFALRIGEKKMELKLLYFAITKNFLVYYLHHVH